MFHDPLHCRERASHIRSQTCHTRIPFTTPETRLTVKSTWDYPTLSPVHDPGNVIILIIFSWLSLLVSTFTCLEDYALKKYSIVLRGV